MHKLGRKSRSKMFVYDKTVYTQGCSWIVMCAGCVDIDLRVMRGTSNLVKLGSVVGENRKTPPSNTMEQSPL